MWRLASTFLDDPVHYKLCPHESRQMFLERKWHLFDTYITHKWKRNLLSATLEHLQHAYVAYMRQCHPASGGLACGKEHAHDREIVNYVSNSYRQFLELVSLAIRIVKIKSGKPSWTVWKQAEIKTANLERVARLQTLPQFGSRCPCGRVNDRVLEVVKMDAAQFFKAASVKRGTVWVSDSSKCCQTTTQKDAVAIYRAPNVQGELWSSSKRKKPHPGHHIQGCEISAANVPPRQQVHARRLCSEAPRRMAHGSITLRAVHNVLPEPRSLAMQRRHSTVCKLWLDNRRHSAAVLQGCCWRSACDDDMAIFQKYGASMVPRRQRQCSPGTLEWTLKKKDQHYES